MSESTFPRRAGEGRRADPKSATRPSQNPSPLRVSDGRPPSAQRRSYVVCYHAFLAAARALPAAQVTTFRGNARVALANVRFGLDNVCADPALVAEHLPKLPLDGVLSIADLARALVYSCGIVAKAASRGEIKANVSAIKKPRAQMLASAETLADKNLFPADEVASVRKARGMSGFVTGAVTLAGLYTTHAEAIRGMHPFSDHDIKTFGENAAWLMESIKPKRAYVRAKPSAHSPANDRDRLGALLAQEHERLRKIGAYFHGARVDDVVPPLLSAVRGAAQENDQVVDVPAEPHTPA